MGILRDLLEWHREDPVEAQDRIKNETVFFAQGNRNSFIDHPEWVNCLFLNRCPLEFNVEGACPG